MRIIAGKHRGRRIEAPKGKDVRPTSSRTREAIFNIISHGEFSGEDSPLMRGAVLDLYCGTGAFGLEALSRGAGSVTFVDRNAEVLAIARQNAERFGEHETTRFLRSDSSALPPATSRYALVFLDPPYHSGLVAPTLKSLVMGGWLEENAVVIVEQQEKEKMPPTEGLLPLSERKYGNTRITLLRYTA